MPIVEGMSDVPAETSDSATRAERADLLKERIYVTFTALALLIALDSHGEVTPLNALTTLVITVLGTLLAVFVADVLSRMAVNERGLSRTEYRHVLQVTLGSIGAIVIPVIALLLAEAGILSLAVAFAISIYTLLAALVLFGFLAVRKVRAVWWKRLIALAALGLVGLAVIALELLAHG